MSEQMKLKEKSSTDTLSTSTLSTSKVARRIAKIRENWSTTQRREREKRAVDLQLTLLAQAVFGRGQAGT